MTQHSARSTSPLFAMTTTAVEEAEQRAVQEAAALLRAIAADAALAPRDYLAETEVPEGGE